MPRRSSPQSAHDQAELHEQIDAMIEEEPEVRLVFAPDWPSKTTPLRLLAVPARMMRPFGLTSGDKSVEPDQDVHRDRGHA